MMNRLLGFLLLFCLLFSGASFAEKPTETALQQGVLLKARDGLPDPRFHNSLVLLVQHDQQGSVGLVVNRPSRLPLADILPEDFGFSVAGETISYGGPVEPETLLVLIYTSDEIPAESDRVDDNLYLTGLDGLRGWQQAQGQGAFRVFTGYAGWGAGQLEQELLQEDWQPVPFDLEIVLGRKTDANKQRPSQG